MSDLRLYPLCFRPIYKSYIWGGGRIATCFGRSETPTPCAESWELSGILESSSIITNGYLAGRSLADVVNQYGTMIVGEKSPTSERFPLLIKILDAQKNLSVQVHPNRNVAKKLGGDEKNEMWYILDSTPLAKLWLGVKEGGKNFPQDLLEYSPKQGDVYNIPAGLVHALGAGNLVFEVQQSSDTTYRIYDWGNGRELHLNEASIAADVTLRPEVVKSYSNKRKLKTLLKTNEFRFASLDVKEKVSLASSKRSFIVLFCESGQCVLKHSNMEIEMTPGKTVLLPPKLEVSLQTNRGARLLLVTL